MSDYISAITTVDATNHILKWETDGHYVVGDTEWQDIVLTAKVTYNGGAIGLTPRVYANNMYVTFSLQNDTIEAGTDGAASEPRALASISAQVTSNLINLDSTYIDELVIGQTYELKAEIRKNNYKMYVDNVLVFNIEYASMPKGKVGVYATANNSCSEIKVDTIFAEGWNTNAASVKGGIVNIRELANEDKYLYLQKPEGGTSLYAEQVVNVTGGSDHTLSFNAEGAGIAYIIEANGASPSTYQMTIPSTASWTKYEMTKMIKADCTQVKVRLLVQSGELKVNAVQLEPKPYSTDYIHNESTTTAITRESSFITYPSKNNITPASGSISMWVKPTVTHTGTTLRPILFEYGDANGVIRLDYDGTGIRLKYGKTETVTAPTNFDKETWYHVVGMWSQYELSIYVNNTGYVSSIDEAFANESEVLRFGHGYADPSKVFLGVIDETILFKGPISEEEITRLHEAAEPIANNNSMVMRATFNHSIGNFDKSHIEATLAPTYGSPIVIEKEDGTAMRKVSFFDYMTGEYQTYNEEQIIYDGESDYLEVSYYDIDTENFKVIVRDEAGTIFGDPYTVEGNRVYVSLSKEEKDGLYGKPLFVSYQLENSYTVDFNIGVPDSFRINIGKHDGQPLKITYEGNDFHSEKLATMVEMNPMLNPNHEGFLYITRNVERVASYRTKATPEDLHADGVSEALVVIEPLDVNGNFISHARLDVSARLGQVTPNYDSGSIKSKERAGRYLYKYRAAKIMQADAKSLEVTDYINVIDRETGLGVKIPITLTTIQVTAHKVSANDTLQGIADMYGTTIVDIMEVTDMDQVELNNFIKANVGGKLSVPQSYSRSVLDKTDIEKALEVEAVYIVNRLMEYLGQSVTKLPAGLGTILDFNNDGMITVEEFEWINANKRSATLRTKYRELRTWDESNAG
jgi:hypothetical protein